MDEPEKIRFESVSTPPEREAGYGYRYCILMTDIARLAQSDRASDSYECG